MKAIVLLKEYIESENRVGDLDYGHYSNIIDGINDSIAELESLQNENKSLVKTLEKYNEEMKDMK